MKNWLSLHVFPFETPEIFLVRGVKPFLEQHVWPEPSYRAFFIRYDDDEQGHHIRLRFRTGSDELREPAIAWFGERGRVEEVAYTPEPERFGGSEALVLAEGHFHLSTRTVLDRLAAVPRVYADGMFDALRLHVIALYSAGFSRDKASWYFGQLFEQWLPLFFPGEGDGDNQQAVRDAFEDQFLPQRENLRIAVDELWSALKKGKFDSGQPEWQRWQRGNELILDAFGDHLERALPSLIHLTNNRLGIDNQDEVFLNYLLWKSI